MAWGNEWGSKARKESANGRRSGDRREAIIDAMDPEPAPSRGIHKKNHKKKKKNWVIEYRYLPKNRGGIFTWWRGAGEWAKWNYYDTEKKADDALFQLTKSKNYYEFRKLECEP